MRTAFWKMSGAGNDFVVLAGAPRRAAALARRLCDRRRGIGADGLLTLSRRAGRVRAAYWNSDGTPAFCGNAVRCAALWAASRGWIKAPRAILQTSRGPLDVRLLGRRRAAVAMPAPRARPPRRLRAGGRSWLVRPVDAGVPHAVVAVADVDRVDVRGVGRALRRHPAFGRTGTNVDFVQARGRGLTIRTYERGVEDETLACGTGAVAAAFVARGGRGRAAVRTRGGETLSVAFDGGRAWLAGPGDVVFAGTIAR